MSENIALKQARKDETQNSVGGVGGGGGRKTSLRPPEQTLKCPRCDSTNTKFCYYNNYNLTQPRHFCRTCRRYWTKGGALRNIPIGGGCRKNKKTTKSYNTNSSKFIIGDSSSSDLSPTPVIDFQLGGINLFPPRIVNQFPSSYGETSTKNVPFMNLDPLGFNFTKQGENSNYQDYQEMEFTYANLHQTTTTLTSSIESLSSLNQDLHWKLQQQRFASSFGRRETDQQQQQTRLQPIMFHNLEISKPPIATMNSDQSRKDGSGGNGGGGLATEWFFDNGYAPVNVIPTSTNDNNQKESINDWNGSIQAWSHVNQYNALP